ncbi:MAG: GNAT family N-acetyltransferase [Deltaproteobacteria bacterium]|nr:GNAT family N-acetyltransferase [Deltaproteobacteria bacterium]
MSIQLRSATPDDAEQIHRFVVALAEYEREPDAVRCTADELRSQLAEPEPPFRCLLAELDGTPAGFALYFHNYSTWRGRAGLYLEDLFVLPELRGRGVGKRLLAELARIAQARGCARMEWAVLDWNQSAIDFYRRLGAEPMSEWTLFRLTDDPLADLAKADV